MKKIISLLLAAMLTLSCAAALGEQVKNPQLVPYDYDSITVGNPTPLNGQFFTDLWGNATSDIDVRHLVTGYDLVIWDSEKSIFRFDRSVVSGAMISDDEAGNRSYLISLYSDLYFSDGTPINAWSYAFSVLLQSSPLIGEMGGHPAVFDYLVGYEDYAAGKTPYISGLRVPSDDMILLTVKGEALPYFYELSRIAFCPYPIHAIAPGCAVYDDGEGAYIGNANAKAKAPAFTAELLKKTVMDEKQGYQVHPNPGSGPYSILSYDGEKAVLEINPYFKGNEKGDKPRIKRLTYTRADNGTMIRDLSEGKFALLNKVLYSSAIRDGLQLCVDNPQYFRSTYPRIGLTYLFFNPNSAAVQSLQVRRALAHCFDKPSFVSQYAGYFGVQMDCFAGLGQWMYGLAAGTITYKMELPENATKKEEAAYEKAVKDWEQISLDGIARYAFDPEEAARLLGEDGWTLNEQGGSFAPGRDAVRCKRVGDALQKLELTLGYPAEADIAETLSACLTAPLAQAGVQVTLTPLKIGRLVDTHSDYLFEGLDLIYLGDNFNISFDPALFFREEAFAEEKQTEDGALLPVYRELYALSEDMDHTEPRDVLGYMQKWLRFQDRLTRLLPVIPVYSNVYFDFYTRELDEYWIEESISWGKAIVAARMHSLKADGEDDDMLEAELFYANGEGALDLAALLGRTARETTDYTLGALARFPAEVRSQVPADYKTINEFVAADLKEKPGEDDDTVAVKFSFQTPYAKDETVYLLFGIPGKGSDMEWIVREGVGLEDGSVSAVLDKEQYSALSGNTFALAVVSR